MLQVLDSSWTSAEVHLVYPTPIPMSPGSATSSDNPASAWDNLRMQLGDGCDWHHDGDIQFATNVLFGNTHASDSERLGIEYQRWDAEISNPSLPVLPGNKTDNENKSSTKNNCSEQAGALDFSLLAGSPPRSPSGARSGTTKSGSSTTLSRITGSAPSATVETEGLASPQNMTLLYPNRKIVKKPPMTKGIEINMLKSLFGMKRTCAQKHLNLKRTTFSNLCRYYGIPKWPYRTLRDANTRMQANDKLLLTSLSPARASKLCHEQVLLKKVISLIYNNPRASRNSNTLAALKSMTEGQENESLSEKTHDSAHR